MTRKSRAYADHNTSVKQCPACSRTAANATRLCPCGYEFFPKRKRQEAHKTCKGCKASVHNTIRVCQCGRNFYAPRDQAEAGINRRGERNGANKLKREDVRYIRTHARLFKNTGEIAAKFNIRRETVRAILHGEIWSWLL